eukprot:TRINITY_DN22354_c0_g1_i1.p1 TRINITY_DN22354_c0_g1~~TRINITY_DN22354_c0_g1_i1.p1  ORF type:complete len:362 (+),score=172.23 TRINITY_DN22354_c0_g1_i1:76-1086(+)
MMENVSKLVQDMNQRQNQAMESWIMNKLQSEVEDSINTWNTVDTVVQGGVAEAKATIAEFENGVVEVRTKVGEGQTRMKSRLESEMNKVERKVEDWSSFGAHSRTVQATRESNFTTEVETSDAARLEKSEEVMTQVADTLKQGRSNVVSFGSEVGQRREKSRREVQEAGYLWMKQIENWKNDNANEKKERGDKMSDMQNQCSEFYEGVVGKPIVPTGATPVKKSWGYKLKIEKREEEMMAVEREREREKEKEREREVREREKEGKKVKEEEVVISPNVLREIKVNVNSERVAEKAESGKKKAAVGSVGGVVAGQNVDVKKKRVANGSSTSSSRGGR